MGPYAEKGSRKGEAKMLSLITRYREKKGEGAIALIEERV